MKYLAYSAFYYNLEPRFTKITHEYAGNDMYEIELNSIEDLLMLSTEWDVMIRDTKYGPILWIDAKGRKFRPR